MKLLNNFHQKLVIAGNTSATLKPCCEQKFINTSEINSLDEKSSKPQTESSSDYISAIFSESQLPRLYKFESEDSGVELASGANSPSTPSASEQSFVAHSRESSCDSCNSKNDCTDSLPYTQNSETRQTEDLAVNTQDIQPEQHSSSKNSSTNLKGDVQEGEDMNKDQSKALGISPEEGEELPETLRENSAVTERRCFKHMNQCGKESVEMTGNQSEPEPLTNESLEEYMDHCCRISEVRSQPCPFSA